MLKKLFKGAVIVLAAIGVLYVAAQCYVFFQCWDVLAAM